MARVLIVGCGCRGRELATRLIAAGHAVRGTTRDPDAVAAIDATGAEGVVADPLRLMTVALQFEGVSAMCWLMAGAEGEPDDVAALHGPRLESLLGKVVDTPVRGFVYEARGSVDQALLAQGAAMVAEASERHRMPTSLIEADPADNEAWADAAAAAVEHVLA
jgi:uncharacterized protein YbjT (DUF2867 family)